MPFDALARTSLQSISGLTEVKNENGEVVATAVEWLVQVFDNPDAYYGKAADYKIFRIEHDQLLGVLELPRRPGFYRYSLKEILRNGRKLEEEFAKSEKKREEGKALDLYDAKLEEISRKQQQFARLVRTPPERAGGNVVRPIPPQSPNGDWEALATIDLRAAETLSEQEQVDLHESARKAIWEKYERQFGDLSRMPEPGRKMIERETEQKLRFDLLQEGRSRREKVSPAAATFTAILDSARRDKGEFNAKFLETYQSEFLAHVSDEDKFKNRLEAKWLGQFAPFYHCEYLYLPMVIFTLVSWIVWMRPLLRAAFWLGLFAFAVHTLALILRMYVQGRPPVTNLYASAVFIGWGAVGLALLLEWYYKNGVGSLVAGTVGAATLQLAHFLGGSGDTMAMLVAVLDTNFWLATHVTTVTLGYTATLVAGMIAVVYIIRGVGTTTLDDATAKSLGQMMYGVICFATLLSFVGTVLGGIWADYSWGRFWGWDPKENGAVLIVIWNALILHARWGGMIKVRGMAVLALFGNMVTAWSWFGTNQLGIGLHAYGFDNRLAAGCRWFWLSQLALMGVGMIPRQYWRSQPGKVAAAPAIEQVQEKGKKKR
ncbi:MAG: cytochrome c biogenesis protein CcsA [Planctomycetia bacterium]|nr:cytochrome c biogenesis protein CcsA [Planctomycetia bacterium]